MVSNNLYFTFRLTAALEIFLTLHVLPDPYISDLAMDYITGNLYVVSRSGDVVVCNTASSESLFCRILLRNQGYIAGIFLDPNSGFEFHKILFSRTSYISR